jgi:PmbA protein
MVGIAMRNGFDEAVAQKFSSDVSYIKIVNSEVDSIVRKREESMMLFLSNKKRVFFTNIENPTHAGIGAAIKNAKTAMRTAVAKKDYNGIAEGPFKYRNEKNAHGTGMDDEDAIDATYSAIDSAKSSGADMVAGMMVTRRYRTELETSKDVSAADSGSMARLSIRAFGEGRSAHGVIAEKDLGKLDSEELGKTLASIIGMTKKKGRIKSGRYDIAYLPPAAGLLLSSINEMACIGSIETGSFLAGKLGSRIADSGLSIYDDGMDRRAIGTSRFDAEGYPTQHTPVIHGGVLKHYLHNCSTAIKYRTRSTGNAGLVLPSTNVPVIDHRKRKKDLYALIGSMDRGLVVTNTWYTRFSNYVDGSFSTVPRDTVIYVERGEPKFAVKQIQVSNATGIRISDNMLRMTKAIEMVGGETVQTSSWDADNQYYFSPSVLVRGAAVTTA